VIDRAEKKRIESRARQAAEKAVEPLEQRVEELEERSSDYPSLVPTFRVLKARHGGR